MRHVYTFFFYLALPFIGLRLLWRSRKAPAYRQRMGERFAYFKPPQRKPGLWVHAVSVGEVIAATPLIQAWQKLHPNMGIVVTTMTPTGSARVKATFADQVFHVYLPYDVPFMLKRFLDKLTPQVLVIMETELWPNLVHCCKTRGIPILLANARLSERSSRAYRKLAWMMRGLLANITLIAAQTQADAKRYKALGAKPQQVRVTGSVKFDIHLPHDLTEQASALKSMLGQARPIWIAASTHHGEESLILKAHQQIRAVVPDALLILVPRHPERFDAVYRLCQKQGVAVRLRSKMQSSHAEISKTAIEVFLGDTMGEVLLFYAVSDVAFVGGSLVPHGGHNILEPAAIGAPIIVGPHVHNFREITQLLLNAQGIRQVQDQQQLALSVIEFLQNKSLCQQVGACAKEVVLQNKGALQTHLQLLGSLF